MSIENKVPMTSFDEQHAAQTYPEHSCYEWNRQHYQCSPEYTAAMCGTCGTITGFKWRKPWRRFVSFFTDEPTLRKEIKFVLRTAWWKFLAKLR